MGGKAFIITIIYLCQLWQGCHASPPSECAATPSAKKAPPGSPNIVLVLTDDMDHMLGGWTPMRKTQQLLAQQGATAKNWMIHTPVCCPSRSELLTGRYFHNIRNGKASDRGCMHVNVTADLDHPFYSSWYFATHLQQAGYTVGIFGKHLNGRNPTCPPPGVDRWFANGGGDYYNPEFSWASAGTQSSDVQFKNCTYNNGACYSTSVIGNVSLNWIKEVTAQPEAERKPFFAFIAVKAPHIQDGPGWPTTLPAPWYNRSDLFPGLQAPRTPNWNMSCPDHHWMIRQQPPMTDEQAMYSDALHRDRWLALLSVDDLVAGLVEELELAGVANNTYVLFTSDHGFQFGQFRLPQGKWNVYDTNLRIPFVVRGPGIKADSTFDYIGSNVDVMPTILGLAGVDTPNSMDGQSLAHLLVSDFKAAPDPTLAFLARSQRQGQPEWRTSLLIEYYGLGNVVRYEHLEDTPNNTYRALRVIDGQRNLKFAEFTSWDNWNFELPADEFELFDLHSDPWEMKNLWSKADPSLKKSLQDELEKLYRCQGAGCRVQGKSILV